MEGARVFWFFCGYIIRCIWIWYDRNRENSLLFYCLVSMIWFTIATNFPWKLLRTYLKKHENTKSGSFFSSSGHLGSDTPKLAEVDAPKKDGTPVAVPTGAINFGEPGTNGTGSPIFWKTARGYLPLIGKKTVWEGGCSMMKLNEPSHCLEVLFFCIMCNYSMLYL